MSAASSLRWRVLVTEPDFVAATAEVAPRFGQFDLTCVTSWEQLAEYASADTAAIVTQDGRVDASLLDRLPQATVLLKLGRNYQNVDAATVRQRGLTFACVPRKGPNCVAELAITFILALSKDLVNAHRSVEQGTYRLRGLRPEKSHQRKMAFQWMKHQTMHEVVGKTLGIIGMGEIGCELARRASVMGMRILYTKRTRLSAELERLFEADYRDLPGLLGESDYVCVATPHTATTERMLGRAELALMKPDAFLVNIARGGIIDEDALIEALTSQQIAGAGLDVFTYEPLPHDSPLCRLHNVILTPHVGGGTGTNRPLELGVGLDELARIMAGEQPRLSLS